MANQKRLIETSSLVLLLSLAAILVACHKKKKNNTPDIHLAPTVLELKTPKASPGFSTTPTYTVYGVGAGEEVRLFGDANCSEEEELGMAVVGKGQDKVDVTLEELPALGSYSVYAKRTAAGQSSPCSDRLAVYQLIGCPDESYVPVDGNPSLGTDSFCVMKTEARRGANDIPVAQYAELPWTSITSNQSKTACLSIPIEHGSCDLISNAQWMTIARDIETNPANWSGGAVGNGTLNYGLNQAEVIDNCWTAITDPTDPYAPSENNWINKRTFSLSNGEVIWDFAGNLYEWVDWESGGDTFHPGPNTCPYVGPPQELYDVDCPALSPDDYMPANPAGIEVYSFEIYGVGSILGSPPYDPGARGYAARGGDCSYKKYAGIYAVDFGSEADDEVGNRGFRCVCTVTGE